MKPNDLFRRVGSWCVSTARTLRMMLSRRLWMKLLSFLLAVLLWNYVVSTNTSITRTKTLTGLSGYITGQSTLTTYELALLAPPEDALSDITVQLDVAQSQFGQVSADTVQVMLDLSSVRTAGTQQVPLRATSAYGRVTSILPDSVTLTFETLDSRLIPVNVETTGEQDANSWFYSVNRTNPTAITVSGAASVVRSISQARVYMDVTGMTENYNGAESFVLLDYEGNEVPQSMLNRSVTSVTVVMDVYPKKELPISQRVEDVVTGRLADGYTITDISIQPESITVAADQGLLDGISELLIEPVNVEGQSQSMVARASIAMLSDFRNVSAEQVYVNITVAEEDVSEWVGNNVLTFVGKADNLRLEWQRSDIQVRVTGPRSTVESLQENGVPITVDLSGLGAGEHVCPLILPNENYPGIAFEPEAPEITITLIETPED